MFEHEENVEAAIAAYKRAMALDPGAADIPAELADLYMRENRAAEAIAAAEQALKIAPANREAHRVLGTIYAALATASPRTRAARRRRSRRISPRRFSTSSRRSSRPVRQADANLRAMLARLYIAAATTTRRFRCWPIW